MQCNEELDDSASAGYCHATLSITEQTFEIEDLYPHSAPLTLSLAFGIKSL